MAAQLQSRLPSISAELRPRVLAALKAGGEIVERNAKGRVKVDTGALRDAIHTEPTHDGVAVIAGDNKVFYGHLVEHGSSRTPPHPFLVPALEESRDEIMRTLTAALGDL